MTAQILDCFFYSFLRSVISIKDYNITKSCIWLYILWFISLDMLSVICSADDNQLVKSEYPMPLVDISVANMNTIVITLLIDISFLLRFTSFTILFGAVPIAAALGQGVCPIRYPCILSHPCSNKILSLFLMLYTFFMAQCPNLCTIDIISPAIALSGLV